tara:strand:- start:205 stop:456 length:252 start_codon:yes stop_codon:yes gene_type:complete
MSKVAMKNFANQVSAKVVLVFIGIAIHMNASVMAAFADDLRIKTVVETNMELVGLIIIVFGLLNIIVGYYLAAVEDEEADLKI